MDIQSDREGSAIKKDRGGKHRRGMDVASATPSSVVTMIRGAAGSLAMMAVNLVSYDGRHQRRGQEAAVRPGGICRTRMKE